MENLKNDEVVEETTDEVEETSEQNDNVEENEEESAEAEETEDESTDDDDYEKELDNLVNKAEKGDKLEKKIAGDAYKYRKNKNEGSESEDEEGESKYVTRAEMLASEQRILRSQIDNTISSVSSSPSEAKLIKWYMDNYQLPGNTVAERVENAKVLANKRKILQENTLAKKSAQSASSKGKGTGAGQKKSVKTEAKLSDQDKKIIKVANMTWNSKSGRYEGKKTFYAPNAPEGQKTGRL